MESNVTLKLDDSLLKRAKKAAVDEEKSLSGWVAGLVAEHLRKRGRRQAACRRALAALATERNLKPGRLTRSELHDR